MQNSPIEPIESLPLPEVASGDGAITYTLTGPNGMDLSMAVPGLTFDAGTRVLSGTPAADAATRTFTYTATNTQGADTLTFDITVAADTVPAFSVASVSAQDYVVNTMITSLTLPLATGGNGAITYTLTGPNGMDLSEVPGLTFDATDTARVLSGTPTAIATATAVTYTAMDADGNTAASDTVTLTFNITVAADTAPAFDVTTLDDQDYVQNMPIESLTLPATTGGNGAITYTLTGPNGTDLSQVPGLTFNPGTRILSGTPITVATTADLHLHGDGRGRQHRGGRHRHADVQHHGGAGSHPDLRY